MKRRTAFWIGLLLASVTALPAQSPSPYSNNPFQPITMTGAGTSAAISFGPRSNSYAACALQVTGSSLTTATIGVTGTIDGTNYFALGSLATAAAPTTIAATATVTANTLLYFNCAGLRGIKYVASGTFTATSITLTLVASPNAELSKGGGGATGAPIPCVTGNDYPCLDATNPWTGYNTWTGTLPASKSFIGISGTHFAGTGSTTWPYLFVKSAACASLPAGMSTNGTLALLDDCGTEDMLDLFVNGNLGLSVNNGGVWNFQAGGNQVFFTNGSGFSFNFGTNINAATGIGNAVLTPVSSAISSATGGSGVTSVTCATANCKNLRGTYTIVGGTFTTGAAVALVWPTTTAAYDCTASQNGGAVNFGIGNSVATATGMNITADVSIAGATVSVDYSCAP